jgi:uncharacterized RDD family membrane protein YckC
MEPKNTAPQAAPPKRHLKIVNRHRGRTDYSQHRPAGFRVRFVAAIVDTVILGIGAQLVTTGAATLFPFKTLPMGAQFVIGLGLQSLVVLCLICYPIHLYGFSPGKKLLSLRIVRDNGDGQISLGAAFLRECPAKMLSGALLGIGYLMAAFSDKKLALHDRLSGTRVVHDEE